MTGRQTIALAIILPAGSLAVDWATGDLGRDTACAMYWQSVTVVTCYLFEWAFGSWRGKR